MNAAPTTAREWHAYITSGGTLGTAQDRMEEAVAAGVDFAELNAEADSHGFAPAPVVAADDQAEIMDLVAYGHEQVARTRFGDAVVTEAIRADFAAAGYDLDACREQRDGANGVEASRVDAGDTGPRDGARELTARRPIREISDADLRLIADDPSETRMRRAIAQLTLGDRRNGITPSVPTGAR